MPRAAALVAGALVAGAAEECVILEMPYRIATPSEEMLIELCEHHIGELSECLERIRIATRWADRARIVVFAVPFLDRSMQRARRVIANAHKTREELRALIPERYGLPVMDVVLPAPVRLLDMVLETRFDSRVTEALETARLTVDNALYEAGSLAKELRQRVSPSPSPGTPSRTESA